MKAKKTLKITLSLILISMIFTNIFSAYAVPRPKLSGDLKNDDVVFGDWPVSKVLNYGKIFQTHTTTVTSKWNQPRSSGANPHMGVDFNTGGAKSIVAPYAGWIIDTWDCSYNGKAMILQLDFNNNQVRSSTAPTIVYYHLSDRENSKNPNGTLKYFNKGAVIGISGNSGSVGTGHHLHMGNYTADGRWYRQEPNYKWISGAQEDTIAGGRDLDAYSRFNWTGSAITFTSYVMRDVSPEKFKYIEVIGYYRIPIMGSGWSSSTLTTPTSTNYSYSASFSGYGIPSGTEIQFKVRLKRQDPNNTTYSVYAWGPARKYRPGSNPADAAHWSVYYGY